MEITNCCLGSCNNKKTEKRTGLGVSHANKVWKPVFKEIEQWVHKNERSLFSEPHNVMREINRKYSRLSALRDKMQGSYITGRTWALRNCKKDQYTAVDEAVGCVQWVIYDALFSVNSEYTTQERIEQCKSKQLMNQALSGKKWKISDFVNIYSMERLYSHIINTQAFRDAKKEADFTLNQNTKEGNKMTAKSHELSKSQSSLREIEETVIAMQLRVDKKEMLLKNEMEQLKHLINISNLKTNADIEQSRLKTPEERIRELETLLAQKTGR